MDKYFVIRGSNCYFSLIDTGDVDESQILASCETEEDADFIANACEYYSEHLKYLKNGLLPPVQYPD